MRMRPDRSPAGIRGGPFPEKKRAKRALSFVPVDTSGTYMQPRAWSPPMRDQAILRALHELDRWKSRQAELRAELDKVDRQVAYYEALAKDMKKETRPARLSDLLRTMLKL